MGCTPQEMKNKDCKECGMTNHKCLSYFNALPANVVTLAKIQVETYDLKIRVCFQTSFLYVMWSI